mgnify:CR=1 FL=1
MGGGDWDVRQQQQQMILDRAYENAPVPIKELHASTEVSNPDLFDKAYVLLRTIVPGWMMGLFIVVGAITIGTVVFKKQLKNLLLIWANSLKEK